MTRFIMPIILIGIAISFFFVFTNPTYNNLLSLNSDVNSYNAALNNSKMFENERDKLTAKYNAIDPNNISKLERLLPENVDNIRLILEIEQIALPFGMTLKDVKYNVKDPNEVKSNEDQIGAVVQNSRPSQVAPKDYGIFDLEFSTSGSYNNFIKFTKDLESNLRIVDIVSVDFSSDSNGDTKPKVGSEEIYKYNFKIKTYWLKN